MDCKNKKLNSILKRKNLINKIFKKNNIADMIIHSLNTSLSYENPGNEILKSAPPNHEFLKIIEINNKYTKIIIKGFRFYKNKKSGLSPFATSGNKLIDNLETILENRSGETFSFSIVYQKSIDSFVISRSNNNNTFNRIGIFNSHKIIFNSWENEDVRFSKNAFSGIVEAKIDKFKNLEDDVKLIVKNFSFDELYNKIWTVNHKRFDKEKLLNELPGTYKAVEYFSLFSDKNSPVFNNKDKLFFTIEEPKYINDNYTIAGGRSIISFLLSDKEKEDRGNVGMDGNPLSSYSHSIQSYSMIWDDFNKRFNMYIVDMDDTTIYDVFYDGIIQGRLFETPDIKENVVGPSLGRNALIGAIFTEKIVSTIEVPTYNILYDEIKEKKI